MKFENINIFDRVFILLCVVKPGKYYKEVPDFSRPWHKNKQSKEEDMNDYVREKQPV